MLPDMEGLDAADAGVAMEPGTGVTGRAALDGAALQAFIDGHPVASFAIDMAHRVTQWNPACERLLGRSRSEMLGTRLHSSAFYPEAQPMLSDLIVDGDLAALATLQRSPAIPGAYVMEAFFPSLGRSGLWLHFTAAALLDRNGQVVGAIEALRDVTERRAAESALRRVHDDLEHVIAERTAELGAAKSRLEEDIRQRERAEEELRRRNNELTELNARLSMAQEQLVQSDKLASIGQLAAGVAHEINNPIGYIFSNFGTLQGYQDQLFAMLAMYQAAEAHMPAEVAARVKALRDEIDLDFLRDDIPVLMRESNEGIARVRHIVQDLKDFSRVDANQEWVWANLHTGIESTLNIVANEVKYRADLVKRFGQIPDIECLPSQINQVVLNLVVNAAHAIGEQRGQITIATGCREQMVWISVSDNGSGIAPENMKRIFDPFFTTKPIGKGTGLGLSLAYGIVSKHQGRISVASELGQGTTFTIELPVHQTAEVAP